MESRPNPLLFVILVAALIPAAILCGRADKSPRKEVERLKSEIAALEGRVAHLEQGPSCGCPRFAQLEKLKLPEGATRAEIRSYIEEIRGLSQNQRMFSPADPQVRMLAEIGPENLDILLDSGHLGFHERAAVKRLAGNEHKKAILDRLLNKPELIEIVVVNGWEVEARPLLVAGLENAPDLLPVQWIEAVARIQDPELYPLLRAYLVQGANKRMTYDAIENLPGIELEEAVQEAWEKVKNQGREWDKRACAHVAVKYGHADALELLVESLQADPNDIGMYGLNETLALHTEVRGTPAEIQKWYLDNRESLVFDPEKRAFVVR